MKVLQTGKVWQVAEALAPADPSNLSTNSLIVTGYSDSVNDFGAAWDSATGVFATPATKKYDFNAYQQITKTGGFTSGYYFIGLFETGTSNLYAAAFCNIASATQEKMFIELNALAITVTAGTNLEIRVLNATGETYTPPDPFTDLFRFSVREIS